MKRSGVFSVNITKRLGSRTGRVRSRTALTKLKIAVFAPIPKASDKTATSVKPGDRRKPLRACRVSASMDQ